MGHGCQPTYKDNEISVKTSILLDNYLVVSIFILEQS
jgi:hypothetical protein